MKKPASYEWNGIVKLAVLFFCGIAGYYLFMLLNRLLGGSYGTYPCILTLALIAGIAAGLSLRGALTEPSAVFLIFVSAMALRIDYIYYTSCYMRQQDTLIFDYPMGHLGYIGYLYYNHHLPDFDTRTAWSFSHPPLHHIISAVWVKINTKLGLDLELAIENIQLLTLFYSMGILLFLYLLLKELNVKGLALYAVLLILAFHPTFIFLSGSVNNDVLSIFFMTGALLYTVRWYRDSSMKNILILAVMIGCAMMSKVSAGLIAPAVGVVFLIRLWKDRNCWKRYFCEFAAFGALVFPLGLWSPLRNNLLFGVPFNYAEKLKLTDPQYIGDIPLLKRFTDFSAYQFCNLDIQFPEAGTYREFNLFIGLLKTAVFGQSDFYHATDALTASGTLLFWLNVVLVAVCAAALLLGITKYRKEYTVEKVFFMLMLVTFMVSYFQFCIQYPHICTMNVRYIIPVLLVGLFFLALLPDAGKGQVLSGKADGSSWPGRAVMLLASIWSVLSCIMFVALGTI